MKKKLEFLIPAVFVHNIDEGGRKRLNGEILRKNLIRHCDALQSIHNICDLDPGWASHGTRVTRRTNPYRVAFENGFHLIRTKESNDLSRSDIHCIADGARTSARAALNTLLDFVSVGDYFQLLKEGGSQFAFPR
jgi:hypothetical protein